MKRLGAILCLGISFFTATVFANDFVCEKHHFFSMKLGDTITCAEGFHYALYSAFPKPGLGCMKSISEQPLCFSTCDHAVIVPYSSKLYCTTAVMSKKYSQCVDDGVKHLMEEIKLAYGFETLSKFANLPQMDEALDAFQAMRKTLTLSCEAKLAQSLVDTVENLKTGN